MAMRSTDVRKSAPSAANTVLKHISLILIEVHASYGTFGEVLAGLLVNIWFS
jgi:hypothetical protein